MYVVWAALIVAFCVLEGITAQLVSIWFVIGAIAALIAQLCGASLIIQIVVFIAVSIVALLVTRPIVKKKLNTKTEKTNADRCIGMQGVVTEDIDNLAPSGQVKVDGKVWTARSSAGENIPEGAVVTVEKIDGVKLIVK
ncbi:MAG: NfeD family protein [Eubacterium sp.]|nr:NfeD family protein [Eubacterium sp.]